MFAGCGRGHLHLLERCRRELRVGHGPKKVDILGSSRQGAGLSWRRVDV